MDANDLIKPTRNHGFNLSTGTNGEYDPGLTLIEPLALYNIIMQIGRCPSISDPNYLLLLDARRRETYDEGHIPLARTVKKGLKSEYQLPESYQVETKRYIVVYDSLTDRLDLDGKKLKTEAIKLGRLIWLNGAKHPVNILKGGFMLFSKLYPFLRTTKIIHLPNELDIFYTYPICVLTDKLYIGNSRQGNDAKIQKDLKITGFINCCLEEKGEPVMDRLIIDADDVLYKAEIGQAEVLHLPGDDDSDGNCVGEPLTISNILDAVKFIDESSCILVFSNYGLSKPAAICIAYVMYATKTSLKEAYHHCKQCNPALLPHKTLLEQLIGLEERFFGARLTQLKI